MKTPICSRVTGLVGQYRPGAQPVTTPRRNSSSIHLQNGLLAGTSVKIGVVQLGGLRLGSSVGLRNTAICSRVTGLVGQYRLGAQPLTTPRRNSSSMKRQNGLLAGTSVNTGVPQAGGVKPAPSLATSTNTAIWSRVVEFD